MYKCMYKRNYIYHFFYKRNNNNNNNSNNNNIECGVCERESVCVSVWGSI